MATYPSKKGIASGIFSIADTNVQADIPISIAVDAQTHSYAYTDQSQRYNVRNNSLTYSPAFNINYQSAGASITSKKEDSTGYTNPADFGNPTNTTSQKGSEVPVEVPVDLNASGSGGILWIALGAAAVVAIVVLKQK